MKCPHCKNRENHSYVHVDQTIYKCMSCKGLFDRVAVYPPRLLSTVKDAGIWFEAVHVLVDEQAKDAGIWFEAVTAPEAYLQQELRRLHKAIEEGT